MNAVEPDAPKVLEAMTATAVRNNMRQIVDTAYYFNRRYLILRGVTPAAVLLGVEDYRQLTAAAGEVASCDRE